MKKALASVVALSLFLSACATAPGSAPSASPSIGIPIVAAIAGATPAGASVNNALAKLTGPNWTKACNVVSGSIGYFNTLFPKIALSNQKYGQQIQASINQLCSSPPSDIAAGLNDLNYLWFEMQSATKASSAS